MSGCAAGGRTGLAPEAKPRAILQDSIFSDGYSAAIVVSHSGVTEGNTAVQGKKSVKSKVSRKNMQNSIMRGRKE